MKFNTIHLTLPCWDCQRSSPDIQFLYKCAICKQFDDSKYCEYCLDLHISEHH